MVNFNLAKIRVDRGIQDQVGGESVFEVRSQVSKKFVRFYWLGLFFKKKLILCIWFEQKSLYLAGRGLLELILRDLEMLNSLELPRLPLQVTAVADSLPLLDRHSSLRL